MRKRLIKLYSKQQRVVAKRLIDEAADNDFVSLSAPTRTLDQNAKLWPMIEDLQRQVPEMAEFSDEDIKLRFLNALGTEMRFLPCLEGGGMFPVGQRSSTLTIEQFSGLLELIYAYGAKHGVRWTDERTAA